MRRLLQVDPECNPYFLTFLLYRLCAPASGSTEKAVQNARTRLQEFKGLPGLLHEAEIRLDALASFRVAASLGSRTAELIAAVSPRRRPSPQEMAKFASQCGRMAAFTEQVVSALKHETHGNRDPRHVYQVALKVHLLAGLKPRLVPDLAQELLDCADAAFGHDKERRDWDSIIRATDRFKDENPAYYEKLRQRYSNNRGITRQNDTEKWLRLNDKDCQLIASALDAEVARLNHPSTRPKRRQKTH